MCGNKLLHLISFLNVNLLLNVMSKNISSRRRFLKGVGGYSFAVLTTSHLSGCGEYVDAPEFLYGVASGDPLSDRVILWTHARFSYSNSSVDMRYEVATDPSFSTVVSQGAVRATVDSGHTAKVDAAGLSPDTEYFYRFVSGNICSPVGITRTLPLNTSRLKIAVVSCANYPAGFFNVYSEISRGDAEYVVHLGDYIYEYAADGYASDASEAMGRTSQPMHELISLEDYRTRYAQYRSDPDCKVVHAKKPFICVWDDHEVANDAYADGADNHSPESEGDWSRRKALAIQVYHEWMPIRTADDNAKIYRSFDFGNLVSLHMLDTRLIGRDKPIDISAIAGLQGVEARDIAVAGLSSPNRQLLGSPQSAWIQSRLASSNATWQVLGQQVLMARMEFPASVLVALNGADRSAEAQAEGQSVVAEYLLAKATPVSERTAAQAALMDPLLNPKVGYNLDAWDGYIVARETILSVAAQLNKRLVVLAGDTHNAWHSNLTLMGLRNPASAGIKVGEEFATSSISSPGLESYLSTMSPAQIKAVFEGVVDDLNWMDASRRGYLTMTFTPTEAKGEWYFVDTIASRVYTASIGHTATWTM